MASADPPSVRVDDLPHSCAARRPGPVLVGSTLVALFIPLIVIYTLSSETLPRASVAASASSGVGVADHVRGAQDKNPDGWTKPPMPIPKGIAWLHIRKAGTSFVNTLLHHKDVCPDWPDDLVLTTGKAKLFWTEHPLTELCPDGFSKTYESPPGCAGIGGTFDQNEGKVMAFFREPEQRIISEFYMHFPGFISGIPSDFLNRYEGCVAKSLTRQTHFNQPAWMHPEGRYPIEPCNKAVPVSKEEFQLALERVKRMAFIGLTAEWSLSICLFHAMYGGRCRRLEALNNRPGKKRRDEEAVVVKNVTTYDKEKYLQGWTDSIDGPIYAVVQEIFWQRIKDWGVTEERCNRCFAKAV